MAGVACSRPDVPGSNEAERRLDMRRQWRKAHILADVVVQHRGGMGLHAAHVPGQNRLPQVGWGGEAGAEQAGGAVRGGQGGGGEGSDADHGKSPGLSQRRMIPADEAKMRPLCRTMIPSFVACIARSFASSTSSDGRGGVSHERRNPRAREV